jgi:hypothetical protein
MTQSKQMRDMKQMIHTLLLHGKTNDLEAIRIKLGMNKKEFVKFIMG